MGAKPLMRRRKPLACVGLLLALLGVLLGQGVSAQVAVGANTQNPNQWYRNTATLDMDFYNQRFMISNTLPTTYTSLTTFITAVGGTFARSGTSITASGAPVYLSTTQEFVSRGSAGTYIDSAGDMQTAASNVARVEYDAATHVLSGTLVEPAATNQIRNNTMVGAVAGTPGTLPTNWVNGVGNGLSSAVVGAGTSNGVSFVDIRIYGTTSGGGSSAIRFEGPSLIAAAQNQTWTQSTYVAVVGGSTANLTDIALMIQEINAGAQVAFGQSVISPNATLSRYSYSRTLTAATTTYIRPNILLDYASGAAVDITLRIGLPQLEQTSYATSAIATSGAAASRSADIYAVKAATYFDSAGTLQYAAAHQPRLDYETSGTAVPQGILIEESRTNSVSLSTAFSQSCSYATCTNNATTAPDGTTTATKLMEDTTVTVRHYGSRLMVAPITADVSYTYSAFFKAGAGGRSVYMWGGKSGSPYTRGGMVINLTNGSWSANNQGTPTGVSNRSVQAYPNGWYRAVMTVRIDASSTDGYMEIGTHNGTTATYTGDGSSFIYLWGMQIERGEFPTSYIPTTVGAVTRNADVFTIPTTGGWYTAGAGTLGAVGVMPYAGATTAYPSLVSILDGTTNNAATLFISSGSGGQKRFQTNSGGANVSAPFGAVYSPGSLVKMVGSFALDSVNAGFDGTLATLDTSAALPVGLTELRVGSYIGGNALNGWLRRIWYMPSREPDYTLEDYSR